MKKIQITQDLFVKMIKYFYSEEFELGGDELCELYRDMKKGIDQKLDAISKRSYLELVLTSIAFGCPNSPF